MRTLWCLALVLGMASVSGCASAGKKFDTTHVNDIENGVTEKPQIRQWFGEPGKVEKPLVNHPAGGVERWTYSYAESVYGGGTESEALVVDFDDQEVVVDHAYSKSSE